jgi:hypothetical protein
MKKPTRAKKAKKNKQAANRKKRGMAAAKKTQKKKAKKSAAKKSAAAKGCCTLTGSGPDQQHEGLTREQCRLLAISRGKNPHWVAGKCAEPD